MSDYRLLVTGGRDYEDFSVVAAVLDRALAMAEAKGLRLVIVHGDARGLDTMAREWAEARAGQGRNVCHDPHPADWSQGWGAGPRRNTKMVALGADACLSFPGGNGTADCTRKARAVGIRVGVVSRGGTVVWDAKR